MTTPAILILSAAFHALWNFWLKRSNYKLGAALAFMVVATALNAAYSAITAPLPEYSTPLLLGIIAAGLFEGFYFYLLNTAYAKQALGVAYTIMRGGAMVLVWLISTIALHERLTIPHLISVSGILLGIALIQRSYNVRELLASGAHAAYLCAGCIAGYHIAYGVAVHTGAAPAFVFAASMACGVITYIACSKGDVMSDISAALTHERSLIVYGGSACGLSFLLFLTALASTGPGEAISLRNTSVVFGVILSLIAGERLIAIQWLGVACVIGGVMGLVGAG
jgi:drug/metabolite transporter (DMT)-like permease